MQRLTIKELAPYLPYGLKVHHTTYFDNGESKTIVVDVESLHNECVTFSDGMDYYFDDPIDNECSIKPLLRPLSSFNGYFSKLFDDDIDVRTFLNEGFITQENQFSDLDDMLFNYKIEWWPYGVIQLALKHHFDVFGLIDLSLALPIDGKEAKP